MIKLTGTKTYDDKPGIFATVELDRHSLGEILAELDVSTSGQSYQETAENILRLV